MSNHSISISFIKCSLFVYKIHVCNPLEMSVVRHRQTITDGGEAACVMKVINRSSFPIGRQQTRPARVVVRVQLGQEGRSLIAIPPF